MFQILDGHGKGVQGSHYFLRTPNEDAKCAKALVEAAIGGNVPWPDDGEDELIVIRPPPALEDLEQARGPPRNHMKSFASPPRFLIIRGHWLLLVESHGPFSHGPRHVWSCLRRIQTSLGERQRLSQQGPQGLSERASSGAAPERARSESS